MTLAGSTVAVCRATEQAGPLLDALREAQARPLHVPLIEIVPPIDGGRALAERLADTSRFTWLAATSANAVRAVADASERRRPDLPIAVVGRATAAAATALGWSIAFAPEQQTAAGLAAELPAEPGERVLAPMAENARPDLGAGLAARGIDAEVVVAYRNIEPPVSQGQLDELRRADAVLITSPSIIERLAALVEPARLPPLVAIGPSSVAAIEAQDLVVAEVAVEPSVDGLIDAVTRTLSP